MVLSCEHSEKSRRFATLFAGALFLVPLIAFAAPRFLAYWPGVIGLCACGILCVMCRQKPDFPKIPSIVAIAILALTALSSFWAVDSGFALERSFKMALILLPGLLLLAAVRMIKPRNIEPYLKYFVWALATVSAFCCVEMVADYPLYRLFHGLEATQEVAASNLNRSVLALLALFPCAYAMIGQDGCRVTKIVLTALFALMLLFTQSQSAQLGAFMALICFLFFPYSHKAAWMVVGGILVAGTLLAPFIAMWLFGSFAQSVHEMPFLGEGGGFGGDRLEIWNAVASYALRSPVYGHGIEATRFITDLPIEGLYRTSNTVLHPHNFALQIWIEFGAIGALLCSAAFIVLIKTMQNYSYQQARIALPGFLVLLSAASFGYGLWQSWFLGLFIFILALSTLMIRIENNKPVRDTKESVNV